MKAPESGVINVLVGQAAILYNFANDELADRLRFL
jgi:hypothetical protein